MVVPDYHLGQLFTWDRPSQERQGTLGSERGGGCSGSCSREAQASGAGLVVLLFLVAWRWFQRKLVVRSRPVTTESTAESLVGPAGEEEARGVPPLQHSLVDAAGPGRNTGGVDDGDVVPESRDLEEGQADSPERVLVDQRAGEREEEFVRVGIGVAGLPAPGTGGAGSEEGVATSPREGSRAPSPVVLSGGGAGPRLPPEAEGETGWQRSVTVLGDFIDLRWTPGNLKEVFIASVAGATGGTGSAEVSFAARALLTTGDSAGFLRFVSNLGTGGFGRVDEIVRADFPGHVPLALKTIGENASFATLRCAVVEMLVFARVAQKPHPKVLGALAMDDGSGMMPILMPKAECDMEAAMDNDTLALGDRLRLVKDLVEATQHLHGLGVVHRDIKPGNVLVFRSEELGLHGKLADFGFARGIGEECTGMMGTPGYTPFEGMSPGPMKGAAGHDVFAIAMVLLRVCLRKEWRWPNLLTQPGLRTPEEAADMDALLARSNQGEAVALELAMWEFKMSRRTLDDRSFQRWVTRDKLDPALASADWLVELFPGLVSPDPEERDDMDFLSTIVGHLAEVNMRS